MSNWLLFALLGTGTGALYGALALVVVTIHLPGGLASLAPRGRQWWRQHSQRGAAHRLSPASLATSESTR